MESGLVGPDGLALRRRVVRRLRLLSLFATAANPIGVARLALALALPMALDAGTQIIGDQVGGLTDGFRYTNEWLATMTGHSLPASFYVGDALASFSSWMRLLSGGLLAIAVVWFCFPYLDRYARHSVTPFDHVIGQAEAGKRSGRESGRERMTWLGAVPAGSAR